MIIRKRFNSKRNRVSLIEIDNHLYVEKQFNQRNDFMDECKVYSLLANGEFYLPKFLKKDENNLTIHLEFIQGITLLDYLEKLESQGTVETATEWMMKIFSLFKALSHHARCHYSDVNLRNFIVKGDELFLLDFEAIKEGEFIPIAKTLAYYLLYQPVKTSFKMEVVNQCICQWTGDIKKESLENEVWKWVERIEQRRIK